MSSASCSTAWSLWLAPMLPFTMEEAWLSRNPEAVSVHLEQFPRCAGRLARTRRWPPSGRRSATVRRVVTGALEIERREKRIGSSLEAAPVVHVADADLRDALEGLRLRRDLHHLGYRDRSQAKVRPMRSAWTTSPAVAVVPALAEGRKCARSWRITERCRLRPGLPGCFGPRRGGTARIERARPALNDILAAADCGSGRVSLEAVKKWPELSVRGPRVCSTQCPGRTGKTE